MGHFNACQLLKLQNWDLSKLTPPSNYLSSQINITVRHALRKHNTNPGLCYETEQSPAGSSCTFEGEMLLNVAWM